MPMYSHQCPKCQHEWDVFKRLAQCGSRRRCPECRGMTKQLLFARPNIKRWPPAGTPASQRRPGGGLHMEHMGHNGKTFYTPQALRDHCRKEGLYCGILDG